MRKWTRVAFMGAIGCVAGGALGCAEERAPINRVQANALAKSFFVGADLASPEDDPEFWTRSQVVDVGYGANQDGLFNSSWAQAEMSRIKWVIQEDLLVGRITYERVADSDGKGATGAKATDGVIAVAFPIIGHFDIKRAYNAQTGEESNVIEENVSDRPWHEREYMRVDWSRNLNTDSYDFDTLSIIGVWGGVHYEPLAYYVNDPNDPDAPVFDPEDGYFDVTTKAFAKPATIDLSSLGWGIDAIPACVLDNDVYRGTFPSGTCNPVEITVRHAFRRVVDTDYEPVDWDGIRFQAYGAFTADRIGYDRQYGMSDDKWHRFATRFNIWERSHFYDDAGNPLECFTPDTTLAGQDPHRDLDEDGTEDECEGAGKGSRCDTFSQKCTLPYRNRTIKPLAWYYTQGSNLEYFDGTDWATHEWDVAMRGAVQVARYGECARTKASKNCAKDYPVYFGQMEDHSDAIWLAREVDACRRANGAGAAQCTDLADTLGKDRKMDAGVIALAKMDELVVLCHSPVAASDPEACGPKGMVVRMGDLRYHNVNVFQNPQVPSAWGIYTDSEDPLTGEKISSSANVWSHVTDMWSRGVIDVVRYIKGELSPEEVTDGQYVGDWVKAAERMDAAGGMVENPIERDEVDRRMADFVGMKFDDYKAMRERIAKQGIDQKTLNTKRKVESILHETRAHVAAPSANRIAYEQRRAAARGTELEAELMKSPAIQQYSGIDGLPVSFQESQGNTILNAGSPLRGASPHMERDLKRMTDIALANRGSCILGEEHAFAPAPLAVSAMADILEEKFGKFEARPQKEADESDAEFADRTAEWNDAALARAERMRRWLAQRAHFAVMIHEMGHSVGMRHNFLSSYDSFSYRPQYWQLRTKNGAMQQPCETLDPTGACVGPRYFDPVTEEERKGLIHIWSHSSVMDYPGEHIQETLGLGMYDFAAVRMFYGDMVAVYTNPDFKKDKKQGKGVVDRMDTFGGILGLRYTSNGSQDIHYSQLQKNFEMILPDTCREIDPADFKPSDWNEERDGKWHPLMDGLFVQVDGKYTRCDMQPVDYVPWTSLEEHVYTDQLWRKEIRPYDRQGRTRVPYPFATDSWADLGNLSVYRSDNGADPYELVNFWIAQSEVNHIFDNYRRKRQSFSVRSAASRTLGRYSEKMRDAAKGLGLLRNIYHDVAIANGDDTDGTWNEVVGQFYQDNVLLSGIVFDHFARQMARPQPGPHTKIVSDDVMRVLDDDTYIEGPVKVVITDGIQGTYDGVGLGGKMLNNALSEDKGEYDRDFTLNAGSYYDKIYSAMLMTESEDNFISSARGDFLDPRFRSVSLADLFPEGWRRWMANNLTGDDFVKGPRLTANDTGNPEVGAPLANPPITSVACVGAGCAHPLHPIGWTSWWPVSGPESCFPANGSIVCKSYVESKFQPMAPAATIPIDPQIGWDQQKFLIANTFVYLPENQQQFWFEMMTIWELGEDADPGIENRIEFHNPLGKVFIAKTYGKETLFGKQVQKGIAARVLEWGNFLLQKGYQTEPGPDLDGDGKPDWFIPALNPQGQPIKTSDAWSEKLERYQSVIWFLSNTPYWMKLEKKGVYDL